MHKVYVKFRYGKDFLSQRNNGGYASDEYNMMMNS